MPIEPHEEVARATDPSETPEQTAGASQTHGLGSALAYSSVIAAAVAAALVSTVALAFGLTLQAPVVLLAAGGTLVVYNIDRLRDLDRDTLLAPARSAFVTQNRSLLVGLTGTAAIVSVASGFALPRETWILCGAVLALGLLHRRLKKVRGIKTLYLTASWLAVTVGLPLAANPASARPNFEALYWVGSIVGCAILANLMASNLDRSRADESPRYGVARRRLNSAIAVTGLGMGLALVAPDALRGLVLIPGAEFFALLRHRDSESYRAIALDGALLVGACGAIAFFMS